jgi:hypothetical protein
MPIRRNVPVNPASNMLFQLNLPNPTVRPIFRGGPLTSLLVRLLIATCGYIVLVTAS